MPSVRNLGGRQSLVTPIDWKQVGGQDERRGVTDRRQSLVTPIDWKQGVSRTDVQPPLLSVANLW